MYNFRGFQIVRWFTVDYSVNDKRIKNKYTNKSFLFLLFFYKSNCSETNVSFTLFQFYLSYHLYIVACAGAGATVVAMVSDHVNAGVYSPVVSSEHH